MSIHTDGPVAVQHHGIYTCLTCHVLETHAGSAESSRSATDLEHAASNREAEGEEQGESTRYLHFQLGGRNKLAKETILTREKASSN